MVAPPTTPTVLILDASPRPEIQWQTNEQEGYQVSSRYNLYQGPKEEIVAK